MTLTLTLNDLILLILVQGVITANFVLCGVWLRDVYIQRKADRKWAEQVNAQVALEDGELDSWLDDSHVVTYNDDLPY